MFCIQLPWGGFSKFKTDLKGQRLTKICNYIDGNISKDFIAENVFKESYLRSRQVNRILNNAFNMGFHRYLTSIRNETAIELLKESSLSVYESAKSSGYL